MKAIYWRPQQASPKAMLTIGLTSMAALIGLLMYCDQLKFTPDATELAAAQLAEECFHAIKEERLRRGPPIDERFDPHRTGLIGLPISDTTSKVAPLSSKQLSINPNFAAAIVRMLVRAGVQPGDTIAVGWSGSFPALNIALCAAMETMDLHPIVVASGLSSQYGANLDNFLWLDMEKHLANSALIGFRSDALTIGGTADRAMGASPASRAARDAVTRLQQRTQVPWLGAGRLRASVDARMELYDRANQNTAPVKAYVNIGGGIASMGGTESRLFLRPGLNRRNAALGKLPNCVARRFAERGCPVIHLAHARTLAKRYGLNTDLETPVSAGKGKIFHQARPRQALAALMLIAITAALHGFVSSDYGYRGLDRLRAALRPPMRKREFTLAGEPPMSQLMV